ncbi:glycoside hydrolase family 3 N-terminal domain-containing protein [Roseivirga thermotolerans]|uniref:glycoside hydrolase family 3 N-terminal domain-containing protein n=1 Tax=Roseivirga thermotolerans TaxID=1758176 RepID=UPI00273D56D7|nr:glycoside hydrolase family 3 N-terminal domain-containing protein [Roseivirga thermotolerans]
MFKKVILHLFVCSLSVSALSAQKFYHTIDTVAQQAWADSVFQSLSPEERIGQLFMVAAYSNRDQKHVEEIRGLIEEYNIGGLIFFQGGPYRQAKLSNEYQALAKVPLAVAMDAEWGVGMRLDSVYDFPKQMTLGAIRDRKWIYEMGKEVANQFKIMNMHINFAPVVDVNVNPKNPVIGYRSFGETKEEVALRGIEYMKGLQHHGIMANAKHFPGHGDTEVDSHYDLPVITHSKNRMSETELYPFKALMNDSLMSVMVAHLQVPAYDSSANTPTTLSKNVVTDLLKGELGFEGLAFTDAMNMQGVAKYYDAGEADVKALQAGNDVILFPLDVPKAIKQIQKALKKGTLTQAMLDERVMKILKAKYWFGLNEYKPIDTTNLSKRINNDYAIALNKLLYQKAITVVDNSDLLIPTISVDKKSFASISIGETNADVFQNMLNRYTKVTPLSFDSLSNQALDSAAQFSQVIIAYQGITNSPRNQHGVDTQTVEWIKALQKKTNVIVVVMGNAYSLQYFEGVKNLICTYENNDITQQVTPQIIFGALRAEGKLPITAGSSFKAGTGIETLTTGRLSYGLPEEAGMSWDSLRKIDGLIEQAIKNKATPGAQLLIARKGKVVYEKQYGFQTYNEERPVDQHTIYDIASVTKVAATTQILMRLYDEKKLDINKPLGYYLKELKGTNKEGLIIRDVLAHQAGLKPYIPFWEKTVTKGQLNTDYFTDARGPSHNYRIQEHNLPVSLNDSIWKWTVESSLRELPKKKKKYDYLYSDLGYTLIFRLVEKLIDEPVEDYLMREFYAPLGMSRTMYQPRSKGYYKDVAPTEVDSYFRNTIVCGDVHDQNATLMGGIAGHAGLFSTANDLAILLQMNLQMGYYAGKKYFEPWTIPIFSTPQSVENRRGMGWDKPITGTEEGPTSKFASASTFGHTGFTGAAIWADPAEELVFVFLCNRTYPDSSNFKLIEENIRTRIQDMVYQSILEP